MRIKFTVQGEKPGWIIGFIKILARGIVERDNIFAFMRYGVTKRYLLSYFLVLDQLKRLEVRMKKRALRQVDVQLVGDDETQGAVICRLHFVGDLQKLTVTAPGPHPVRQRVTDAESGAASGEPKLQAVALVHRHERFQNAGLAEVGAVAPVVLAKEFQKLLDVDIVVVVKVTPPLLPGADVRIELVAHLAAEVLAMVTMGAVGVDHVRVGQTLEQLVVGVREEVGLVPGQGEPGSEDQGEPRQVVLFAGFHRDENVVQ